MAVQEADPPPDFLLLDQDPIVDQFLTELEGDRVGLDAAGSSVRQGGPDPCIDDPAGPDRIVHHRRVLREAADDPDPGTGFLEAPADPGDQPATSDGDQDRVEGTLLAVDLQADGALSADHRRVVVGRDECFSGLAALPAGPLLRLHRIGSKKFQLHRVPAQHLYFPRRGCFRQKDGPRKSQPLQGVSDGEAVVAGGRGDDSGIPLAIVQGEQFVGGAAVLERTGPLKVFQLQPDLSPRLVAQSRGWFQGSFPDEAADPNLGRLAFRPKIDHGRNPQVFLQQVYSPESR